jgi:CheY-like chemotaxis protein
VKPGSTARDAPITVLVVDDEPDMRFLVKMLVSRLGIEVAAEAVDGADALAAFEQMTPPDVPAVVILDNRMPGLSGLDVARQMRERVPVQHIVLFSAHLTPAIEAEAKRIGIDACLGKTQVGDLGDLIVKLTRPHLP